VLDCLGIELSKDAILGEQAKHGPQVQDVYRKTTGIVEDSSNIVFETAGSSVDEHLGTLTYQSCSNVHSSLHETCLDVPKYIVHATGEQAACKRPCIGSKSSYSDCLIGKCVYIPPKTLVGPLECVYCTGSYVAD